MKDYIQLHNNDNVIVALRDLKKGDSIMFEDQIVLLKSNIAFGHKVAIKPLSNGDKVYKYGLPIGSASDNIMVGGHVHTHNLRTDYKIKTEVS